MKKRIAVFDCDGVLLDSSHRYRTGENGRIDLDHWRAHSTALHIWQDTRLPMAAVYKRMLKNPNVYVILATARQANAHDIASITEKLGYPDKLVFRKAGDNQSGTTLKLSAIRPLLNLKQFKGAMVTVFEDNIDYLYGLVKGLNAQPVYVHSQQGH